MFDAFLKSTPMEALVKWPVACPYPPVNNRKAWQALDSEVLRQMAALAAEYRPLAYPVLTANQFMAYVDTGSRAAYEAPYFMRRRKLIAALLGCCAQPNDDDLNQAADGVWLICEESSWVISAHNGAGQEGIHSLPDVENPIIDLFAAQTGMILALVHRVLGPELDRRAPLLCRRIRYELDRRLLLPFRTRDDYWWMGFVRKDLNNWTPWIVSNLMLIASLMEQDRLRLGELLARGCRMLDRYLDIMPQDGGCDEGAAYWNMAGGALLDCLDLLERVTGGQMTFWQDEKLRGILAFPRKVSLSGGWFVNFADCDARPWICGERLQFAGERLNDPALSALGDALRGELVDNVSDTPQLWRLMNWLFHAPGACAPLELATDVRLPDLQLRLLTRNNVTLACKGGHNGESHNHNDVGAFILFSEGEPQIVDAGNLIYTRKTFSDERYTLWNTRSRNHNVPLLGETEQAPGREFAARDVRLTDDGLQLDMAGAYPPSAGAVHCLRSFFQQPDGTVVLTDDIQLSEAQPVTWVFMLRNAPDIAPGRVCTGRTVLLFDPELTVRAEEMPVTDARMARSYPGSLWRLTCTAAAGTRHKAVFRMEKEF